MKIKSASRTWVTAQFRQIQCSGVILKDFSPEGSGAHRRLSAVGKILRKLRMTPGERENSNCAATKICGEYCIEVFLDPPAKCKPLADAVHAGHRTRSRAEKASRRFRLRTPTGSRPALFAGHATSGTRGHPRRCLNGRLRLPAGGPSYREHLAASGRFSACPGHH